MENNLVYLELCIASILYQVYLISEPVSNNLKSQISASLKN